MFPELTRDDVFRLETRRLWLRWPRMADVDDIVRGAGDACVARMTAAIPHPLPRGDTERFVFEARAANIAGQSLVMAISLKAKPGLAIGIVAIEPDRATGEALHLGYWLAREHWGGGLMTEAARTLVDAFFAYADGRELVSAARTDNPASRRVLERCGFASSGTGEMLFAARGAVLPVERFRLDRLSWESLKPRRGACHGSSPRPPAEAALAV